jgi:hypothetical protein
MAICPACKMLLWAGVMLDRQELLSRQAKLISSARTTGTLRFNDAGDLDLPVPHELQDHSDQFQQLVQRHAGGSTPATNHYFYLITLARRNGNSRLITMNYNEKHADIAKHVDVWWHFYRNCAAKFKAHPGCKPAILTEALKALITSELQAKGYLHRWDFSSGLLTFLTPHRIKQTEKRKRGSEMEAANLPEAASASSSIYILQAIVSGAPDRLKLKVIKTKEQQDTRQAPELTITMKNILTDEEFAECLQAASSPRP